MELSEKSLAICAHGFRFSYPAVTGEPPCGIGPIDWEVSPGEFVLLVGATGSGKTTLLRNLVPALVPEGARSGALTVFGEEPRELEAVCADGTVSVGYVSQSPDNQLVCDTVWHEMAFGLENLGVAQDDMRRRVAEVAHFFGIEPWFRRRVDLLSGGQKQVLALASVLALKPRLLLLDEPTAMLDPVAEKNFLHELFRINRELGITVVLATHAPEVVAEYATSVARIAGGRIERGELDEFRPCRLDLGRLECRDTPAGKGQGDEKGSDAIVVRDAYVRYGKGEDWVLRGLDLRVRAGSVHALLGGNGCGKSTLLSAVAGLRRIERGSVENALSSSQALLPQSPKALFACDSVGEELAEWQAACGYSDDDVREAIARFGLSGCEGRHPYDLSGGQQQLLALAKLVLTRPRLLLLDEPTKGLDPESKLVVAKVLEDVAEDGVTVLMATHDLTFAALTADELTLLFDGECACTQPVGEFFADNLFYSPCEDGFSALWGRAHE